MIQGIAFFVVAGLTELALSQNCPQSTSTINSYLQNYQKSQSSTVVYAWTGAHYSGGVWADRKNPSDIITYGSDGGLVSQSFSSTFLHGASSDSSSASASAQCTNADCTTASLSTSACVTSKVDSAGAGSYARAGFVVPPQAKAAKTGTVMLNIPNRMTLTSNVGDESGVWGIVVSVENVKGKAFWKDKGHPDIAPFLVNLLGLKDVKQFQVHSDTQRVETFAVGFELNPQGSNITLIGPEGAGWENMQAQNDQVNNAKAILTALQALRDRFKILPCQTVQENPMVQGNETCHTAEYRLKEGETIQINLSVEFPLEPSESKSDQVLYIETGHGGRDVVQTEKN